MTTVRLRGVSQAQQEREAQAEAQERLRAIFPPGSAVHTVVRYVSASGQMRAIQVLRVTPDGAIVDCSSLVARATGERLHQNYPGVKVGGSGMDMAYSLVYGLSSVLYRDAFHCLGKDARCPSNDHSNDYSLVSRKWYAEHPDLGAAEFDAVWKAGEAERYSPDRLHSDGGYALRHVSV